MVHQGSIRVLRGTRVGFWLLSYGSVLHQPLGSPHSHRG
jgi:hypothetical protein